MSLLFSSFVNGTGLPASLGYGVTGCNTLILREWHRVTCITRVMGLLVVISSTFVNGTGLPASH
jgi:hypothetical protein